MGEVVSLSEIRAQRAAKVKRDQHDNVYSLLREQQHLLDEIQSQRRLRLQPPPEEPFVANGSLDPYEPC